MTSSFGHQTLRSRHRFEGTLELVSALRLSSGRASDVTDAPLLRDRRNRPYIPGSSLRGALRSELERLLSGVGEETTGLRSCVLFVSDDAPGACLTASRKKQEELARREERAAARRASRAEQEAPAAYLEAELCHLCQLFGSPFHASRLVIEDACPPEAAVLQTTVRDGVGIDRDTGAARESVKFDYEVLETGPLFTLKMEVENLTPTDRQLLNLLLALLREGIYVGGKRSGGLGRIRLAGAVTVRGFESAAELWRAMTAGRDPHGALTWEEGAHAQAPAL